MIHLLSQIKKYANHYFKAFHSKGHGVHSPFVFNLIKHVFANKKPFAEYKIVENLRKQLLRNTKIIEVIDLGAGSVTKASKHRQISEIAKNAAKPKKFGQLLFRLVHYYKPATILDLGTSLGITTSYLSLAHPQARVFTLEGAPEIAQQAVLNFAKIGAKNITQTVGNFNDTLLTTLQQMQQVDFAFIDGNHKKEPTLNYFTQILPYVNNETVLVFDDIHWSNEMEKAWDEICKHKAITCTVDLYFIGIVFFNKEIHTKSHFRIRF